MLCVFHIHKYLTDILTNQVIPVKLHNPGIGTESAHELLEIVRVGSTKEGDLNL